MSTLKGSSQFVKGAAILGIAGLVSKLLGALYRIPYQNIAGDKGLYVYTQVYPLYSTLLILATAGFPIAISKMVSERTALGDHRGARKAFQLASAALSVLGLVSFLVLFFGAPLIAFLMGDELLTLPLQAVSWSLLLVPVVAIMRGYFQGHQYMMPTGVSQVVEQLVRVLVILVVAIWLMNATQDPYMAGAGAVFAAFPGALAAVLVLLVYWRKLKQIHKEDESAISQTADEMSGREILRKLIYYALPICLGALVLPLIPLVDSFTVANLLEFAGYQQVEDLKGIFDRGQPLIQFGTFFATSLSLALVPAISEAVAQNQPRIVARRTEVALRLTFLLGLPASFGLALLAEPVNIMLYSDAKGSEAIAIQAFTILFATLGITSSGILQGLGKVMLPAKHLLLGVGIKVFFNVLLIPFMGISGAALATVLAYVAAMALNLAAIMKYTHFSVQVKSFIIKPFLSVILMTVVVLVVEVGTLWSLKSFLSSERLLHSVVGLASVAAGGIAYGLALLITGALTTEDLRFLPKGERIIALLQRLRLLRTHQQEG